MPPVHPLAAAFAKRRSQSRAKIPELAPEEEESLVRSIARRAVGPITTISNVLDTPGAAVRSILAGENPLPGIVDAERRVSGRQLLERAGILAPNRAGLDVGDVAGTAAEIVFNPLTYLNPMGGLTRGGHLLKKAGIVKKTAEVGGKSLGSRVGRMTTTVGEALAEAGPSGAAAARRAAAKAGVNLDDLADEPIGGLIGYGLFRPTNAFGSGKFSQRIAGGLDRVGEALRYGDLPFTKYSPGRHFHQLFNARVREAGDTLGQKWAEKLTDRQAAGRVAERGKVAHVVTRLQKQGLTNPSDDDILRAMFEGVEPPPNADVQAIVDEVRTGLNAQAKKMRRSGRSIGILQDDEVEYFPRRAVGVPPKGGAGRPGPFSPKDGSQIGRKKPFMHVPGGTAELKKIISDPDVDAAIMQGATPLQIAGILRKKFPHLAGKKVIGKGGKEQNQLLGIANIIHKLPQEARKQGLFANTPIADLLRRRVAGRDAIEADSLVIEALAKEARDAAPESLATGEMVSVADVLRRLQLNPVTGKGTGALYGLAKQLGQPATPALLKRLRTLAIPKEFAESLAGYYKGFASPEAVGKLGGAVDSFNSLFKAGVLSWPARHIRDWTSGAHKNVSSGLVGLSRLFPATRDARQFIRGGVVRDAHLIPEVARLLRKRGMPRTAEAGTEVLRELSFANELIGRSQGRMAQVGSLHGQPGAAHIDDLLSELPGVKPTRAGDTVRKFFGRGQDVSLNPLDIQGVGGRSGTRFGPVAASNDVGYTTDALNRLAPWLEQIRKGVKSDVAAEAVRKAQVDYSARALTKTEKALTRWIPFYRFTRGSLPATAAELAKAPGGPLAITLRALAAGRAKDEIVPDYVNETAGIRIPEGTPLIGPKRGGDPRYLTGMGLMFEDSLPILGGEGVRGRALELASHLGPVAKVPIELMTGKSLFQKGVNGAVDLDEQDPLLGRLLANATGRDKPVRTPKMLEHALANSPVSRLLSTLRTASDSRKSPATRAMNLTTGVKFSDVPEQRRDAILRELASKEMKATGARDFSQTYFPQETLDEMQPEQRAAAERFIALNKLLEKRAKARAKERALKAGKR